VPEAGLRGSSLYWAGTADVTMSTLAMLASTGSANQIIDGKSVYRD
jgi:hypothetical protein